MANTTLPAKTTLDGSKSPATTHGEMQQAMGELRDFLAELVGEYGTGQLTPQCLLVYVSATEVRLDRYGGRKIPLYDSANAKWVSSDIPSAGVSYANTGLTAGVTYYIYAYLVGSTVTLRAYTTAPAIDSASGLMVRPGGSNDLLVGKVSLDGSTPGQFQDSDKILAVRSYYNRRGEGRKTVRAEMSADKTTTSTTYPGAELDSAMRLSVTVWDDESLIAMPRINGFTNLAGSRFQAGLKVNSTNRKHQLAHTPVANYLTPLGWSERIEPADLSLAGVNTIYLYAMTSASTTLTAKGTGVNYPSSIEAHVI